MKYSTTLTGLSLVALLTTGITAATALDTALPLPGQTAASASALPVSSTDLVLHYPGSPTGVWTVGAGKSYRTGAPLFIDATGAGVPVPAGTTFAPNSAFPSWVTLNPASGELSIAPPADAAPGHYPLSIYIARPDAPATSLTVYVLVAERSTDTENLGLASLYAPVQVPSFEVARPGETYAADVALYQEYTGDYIAGSNLLNLPDFSRIALPQDAADWVSVSGSSVLFALPADVPAGVTTIWQTVEVIYSDGSSEYFNLFVPVETGEDSPLPPAPEPTLEPTASPSTTPSVSPSQEPTAVPTSEPSAPFPSLTPPLEPISVPTVAPSATSDTGSMARPSPAAAKVADSSSLRGATPAVSASASAQAADKLAHTGAPLSVVLSLAASLLIGGTALAAISRRKKTR